MRKQETLPNLVEIRLVKNEKVFILVVKPLHSVRDTFGKVPDIAVAECLDLIVAVLVHGRYENAAVIDDAPFRLVESQVSRENA